MKDIQTRQKIAILRVLKDAYDPVGSSQIAEELKSHGFELCGRTIRLYLQEMEQEGLVTPAKRGRDGGRTLTYLGHEEVRNALVKERVSLLASRVDSLASQVTFDPVTRQGLVALNLTLLDRLHLPGAIREILPVFRDGMSMGRLVAFGRPGETIGGFLIPPGKVAVGTVCSVTLNGVLLGSRVPTRSLFGGVLEIENKTPIRFSDVIFYSGTSLDPLEVFIKAKLTTVRKAARTGSGRIGAGFREFPSSALPEVERVSQLMHEIGVGGCLMIGKPNQALLDFPVEEDRTGFLINGGLNPMAAVEEAGFPTASHALFTVFDFNKLIHYEELVDLVMREEY